MVGTLEILWRTKARERWSRSGESKGRSEMPDQWRNLWNWDIPPLELDDTVPLPAALEETISVAPVSVSGLSSMGVLTFPAAAIPFFLHHGLDEGVAWINGFCLGRYWSWTAGHVYVPVSSCESTARSSPCLKSKRPPALVSFVASYVSAIWSSDHDTDSSTWAGIAAPTGRQSCISAVSETDGRVVTAVIMRSVARSAASTATASP